MGFDEYFGARKQRGYESEPVQVEVPKVETPPTRPVDMNWWQSPQLVAAETALQAEGKQQMQLQEQQARRERNAALLGDIARMGGQIWANKGGVWKIDRTEPASAAANTRLRELRERNGAIMMQYAQRMQEARRGDAKDAMAKEQTRIALQQQADRLQADNAYRQALAAQKQREERAALARWEAEQAVKMAELAEKTRANQAREQADNKDFVTVNGRKFTKAADGDNYIDKAYQHAINEGMKPLEEYVGNPLTVARMRNAIAEWEARGTMSYEQRPQQGGTGKRANPMSNNKKKNPMQ